MEVESEQPRARDDLLCSMVVEIPRAVMFVMSGTRKSQASRGRRAIKNLTNAIGSNGADY